MRPSSNIVNCPGSSTTFRSRRELGHFHGLRVDVHAVDVVEQNPLLFVHAQAVGLVILRQQDLILQMLFGVVLSVPI